MITAETVKKIIDTIPYVHLLDNISTDEHGFLSSDIEVDTCEQSPALKWYMTIDSSYPCKITGIEPIRFYNKTLMSYPHIMKAGNLCLHTLDYEMPEQQLVSDLKQLKEWIDRYYVNGEKDKHYEHLVVDSVPFADEYHHYWFTDVDADFSSGDYGLVKLASLLKGYKKEKQSNTSIACSFKSERTFYSKEQTCKFSSFYLNHAKTLGIYCFLASPPATYGKFIVDNFEELNDSLTQEQKNYIHDACKKIEHTYNMAFFAVFCGYKTADNHVHWQVFLLDFKNQPIVGQKVRLPNQQIQWITTFKKYPIPWAATENISYNLFFGRGAMPMTIASKKILMLGIGAIGSIVAKTLTRCGAKHIDLYDFDEVHAGNIGRSEYQFLEGCSDKVSALTNVLNQISPFINTNAFSNQAFDYAIKAYGNNSQNLLNVKDILNEYDIIFDCSTDNHLMIKLEELSLRSMIINLSITNHAHELICAFSPDIKKFIDFMYMTFLKNDVTDMFNPSGCWNPTFRASYNDIDCKVQFALKHIINMLAQKEPLTNFYINETIHGLSINKV